MDQDVNRGAARPKHFPSTTETVVVAGLFAVLCIALFHSMVQFTAGKFIYPLDDTYIGMAMAKNFARHGVWGITSHEFTSSTSSPLFVLLLAACFKLTGPNELWPLILSFAFAVVSLLVAQRILKDLPPLIRLTALSCLTLLVPLHVMAAIGMEHSLHIALALVFLHLSAKLISGEERLGWKLPAVTMAMVAVRYEGLFAAGIVAALLLVWKRKPIECAVILASAALPVAAYGLWSVSHGWYMLPNSLLMKGSQFHYADPLTLLLMIAAVLSRFHEAPWLIAPLIALGLALIAARRSGRSYRLTIIAIVFCSSWVHLVYARVGWVYRYEAYLIAMTIMALALAAEDYVPRAKISIWIAVAAAVVGLSLRTVSAMGSLPVWSASIYSQQYQMAQFLSRYYRGASIAANDIGAINYFADLKCLDLVGLANVDVLQAKRRRAYTTALIDKQAENYGTTIALVYDRWFSNERGPEFGGPALPDTWIRLERWRVPDFGILGDTTVSIYATRPDEADELGKHLQQFDTTLPTMVTVLR